MLILNNYKILFSLFIKRFVLLFFLLFLLNSVLQAKIKNYRELFDEANKLYTNKDIKNSLEKYLFLFDEGYDNFEINYNIGCSYYKIDEIGKSRFYFERALFYKPFDTDLYHNLLIIYKKIYSNSIAAEQIIMNKRLIFFIPAKLIIMLLFLFLISFTSLLIIFFLVNYKRILLILLSISFLFSVIFTIIFYIQYNDFNDKSFIVSSKNANIYIGPGDDEIVLSNLQEGENGKIIEITDDFYKVKVNNNIPGWIKKDNIITLNK